MNVENDKTVNQLKCKLIIKLYNAHYKIKLIQDYQVNTSKLANKEIFWARRCCRTLLYTHRLVSVFFKTLRPNISFSQNVVIKR